MSVRSALPWPFRWAMLAIVFGFCAAIGLWAFEFGRDIAGLEKGSKEELMRLQAQVQELQGTLASIRQERDQAQSVANTAGTLVTTEKASHERLLMQVKQLEADNRSLRDDLGFFEQLIPTAGADGVAIRGLQAELQGGAKVKWQVVVVQVNKNTAEFSGRLEVSFSGTLDGKPWTAMLANGPRMLKLKQYVRLDGTFDLPARVVLGSVTAKVMDGTAMRATQTVKL